MRGFEYKVAHIVEGHVLAKRYLTGTDQSYADMLSSGSKRTLEFQGGPMDEREAKIFENDSLFEENVQMRKWDEGAKVRRLASAACVSAVRASRSGAAGCWALRGGGRSTG